MKRQILIVLVVFNMFFINAQQKVTICWDASYSMINRNLENEFKYLDSYFNENPNLSVELIVFNISVAKKENFKIDNGNWNVLKETLKNITYDGATSFNYLRKNVTGKTIFLFSDGKQNLDAEFLKFNGNLKVVNSNSDSNIDNLNQIAKSNNGSFLDLNNAERLAINTNLYKIKINGDFKFFDNLKIININKNTIVELDKYGEYEMKGNLGDTLIFRKLDKLIFEKILDKNKSLNIWMDNEDGTVTLNEVVLKSNSVDAGDEDRNTANGLKSSRSIGYASQTVSSEDFNESAQGNKISDAIIGKVSGVQFSPQRGNDNLSRSDMSNIVIRNGNNSINGPKNALIVLDGVPIYNESVDNLINTDDILDVTVLKGLAATNRFGSDANSGAVLIRTKNGTSGAGGKRENTALLKNNVYEEPLITNLLPDSSTYIEELKKANSTDKAYNLYLIQRQKYKDIPGYYIDIYDFFKKSNQKKAVLILSNVLEKENSTFIELKSTLFKYNEAQNFQLALVTAIKIKEAFPNRIQSYLDVAVAHKNSGNYQTALDILNSINSGAANPNLNFTGIKKTLIREIKEIVFYYNKGLKLSADNKKFLGTNNVFNARVVVEWSLEDAEFEIQFVNPSKRFFKWKHTVSNDRNRIKDELENGYSIEEFEIVGGNEIKGKWIINVQYLGNLNNEEALTHLSCKVYYNFGKTNKSVQTKVIRLKKIGTQAELFKLKI